MRRRARPKCPVGQFFRIGFRRCDEIRDRLKRRFGIDHDNIEGARNQPDRDKVLVRIVGQLRIEARIDRIGECSHQQRVAIRLAGCDGLGTDDRPRPRFVLDDHGSAEVLCHLLRQRPRNHVSAAARRKRHDDFDEPVGVTGQSTIRQQRSGQ